MPKKRAGKKTAPQAAEARNRNESLVVWLQDKADEIPRSILDKYPEHARLIGSLISEWSQVEYKLGMLLALSMEANWKVILPMLYAIDSSRGRLNAMEAGFDAVFNRQSERRAAISALLARAQGLLAQRNKYAHALYGISGTGEMSIHHMGKRTANDLPLHDLDHQYEAMKLLSRDIGRVLKLKTREEMLQELVASAKQPS